MNDTDKKQIITYLKLVDARHRAGEKVCISCYIKRVMDIMAKYDKPSDNGYKGVF